MKTADDHQGSPKTEGQTASLGVQICAEKKAPGNKLTRVKVVEVLADPGNLGLTKAALAEKAGLKERQFYKYLTPDVWREVREEFHRRYMAREMIGVDRSMLSEAQEGDVPAAKLMYQRFDGMGDKDAFDQAPLEINIIARGDAGTAAAGVRIRARRSRRE